MDTLLIASGFSRQRLEEFFGEVAEMSRTLHPLAPAYENDLPIYLCRSPRQALKDRWPALKNYDYLSPATDR